MGYGFGSGDFRSRECTEILESCDMVVTNPPFSLFREFVPWILERNKYCLILGFTLASGYKNIFSYIKENRLWLHQISEAQHVDFLVPDDKGYVLKGVVVAWFTNFPNSETTKFLPMTEYYYDEFGRPYPDVNEKYPKYDNYDAINVNKLADIPQDYYGVMGVPVTFMYQYNPKQFELVGTTDDVTTHDGEGISVLYDEVFKRVLIKRRGNDVND